MNTHTAKINRRWSWKAYFVLIALNILAILAYKAYRTVIPSANTSENWSSYIVMTIEYVACATVGLFLAKRIGLGLPFVEGAAKREPGAMNFRQVVAIAWMIGVGIGVSLLCLSEVVFGPPTQALFKQLGLAYPNASGMLPLPGFLASFYAGVTEETFCRLGGLTLVAWLGSLLFHNREGRPRLGIFWLANIFLALVFGFGHLQTAASQGWPMNPLVVSRGLLLNGIAGLAFGWLYWKYGFESAMLAHFFADIIAQVVYPFVVMWPGEADRTAAFASVAVVILLSIILAVRALRTGKCKDVQGRALKPA